MKPAARVVMFVGSCLACAFLGWSHGFDHGWSRGYRRGVLQFQNGLEIERVYAQNGYKLGTQIYVGPASRRHWIAE